MAAFLVPIDPGLCMIPLEKAIVLIGRQADCDISLTHSRKVSRKHCCIAQVNTSFVIRDLGSTNGIFINGARVKKESGIILGDEVSIGDVRFRLQAEAPSSKVGIEKVNDSRQTQEDPVLAGRPALPPLPPLPKMAPPSMDIPVAIPEEGQDFAVEASIPRMRALPPNRQPPSSGDVIPLATIDERDDVVPLASDSF